jgi:hypothetical protein
LTKLPLLALSLLLLAGCVPDSLSSPTGPTILYLDPHLHSARSGDWGSHGYSSVIGDVASIAGYAAYAGVDQVWLTDHAEDDPMPFEGSESVVDGREYCTASVYCYNEVPGYRMLVHPYLGPTEVGWAQGIEVLTTGGDSSLAEERTGIDEAIALIQEGHRLTFFGSSNNHLGLAGANGVTAVWTNGKSLEEAIGLGHTTAVREKQYTMILFSNGDVVWPAVEGPAYTQVSVYADRVVSASISKHNVLNIDLNALATFLTAKVGDRIVAVTTPVYQEVL